MLVEIDGERVRVFAGLAMRMRLLQILGPVRALRVAQAVARHGEAGAGRGLGKARFPAPGRRGSAWPSDATRPGSSASLWDSRTPHPLPIPAALPPTGATGGTDL
jgi:hypothetical protein